MHKFLNIIIFQSVSQGPGGVAVVTGLGVWDGAGSTVSETHSFVEVGTMLTEDGFQVSGCLPPPDLKEPAHGVPWSCIKAAAVFSSGFAASPFFSLLQDAPTKGYPT